MGIPKPKVFDRAAAIQILRKPRLHSRRYWNDPVAWVHDFIAFREGESLQPYIEESMQNLVDRRRVSKRGPHGLGKTTEKALLTHWFADTRDGETDWKTITTAGGWRQLTKFLWPEIRKWGSRIRWGRMSRSPYSKDELQTMSLKLSTGEAFAAASNQPALIEGAHASELLYIFDESKSIRDETFDAAEGAFAVGAKQNAYAIADSTPGKPVGRFYEIHAGAEGLEDWWARHVTLEEAIAAGRLTPKWADDRRRQWGEKSAPYRNRVLGEFAAGDSDGLIPLEWVELAIERWKKLKAAGLIPFPATLEEALMRAGQSGGLISIEEVLDLFAVVLGVDVGETGDESIIAIRRGYIIEELRDFPKAETMVTTGRVVGLLERFEEVLRRDEKLKKVPRPRAVVDGIGIGSGVVSRIKEQKFEVRAFIASKKTKRKDKLRELGFVNVSAAASWNLREIFDPDNGFEPAVPPDKKLVQDLITPKWWVNSGGKIEVEGKDELRKPTRLGRSPDRGDAVKQAYANENMFAAPLEVW